MRHPDGILSDAARASLAVALSTAASTVLLVLALQYPLSQDWIPFQVAARMAAAQKWQVLYPSSSATSLFDVSGAYREAASHEIAEHGRPAFATDRLTSFVSLPPAAFLLAPFDRLNWRAAARLWRLALAVPLVAAWLVMIVRNLRNDAQVALRWALLQAVTLPLLVYLVVVGQPTAWLVAAALVSLLPVRRTTDALGAVLLALAVLTKATPVIVLGAMILAGRWRFAGIAALIVGLALLASFPWVGADGWQAFFGMSRRLSGSVIGDWNSVSVDSSLVRMTLGVSDEQFRAPEQLTRVLSWAVRLALLGFSGVVAFHGQHNERRVAAAWIAWVAAVPLLWTHYLSVLVPLFGAAARRLWLAPLGFAIALSAIVVVRLSDGAAVWIGNASTAVWLTASVWLLSRAAWQAPTLLSTSGRHD